MNAETSRRIDYAIADRPMAAAERQLLRHMQMQLDREQHYASAVFAALEAGSEPKRAALCLVEPELYAVWDECRRGGFAHLVVPAVAAEIESELSSLDEPNCDHDAAGARARRGDVQGASSRSAGGGPPIH